MLFFILLDTINRQLSLLFILFVLCVYARSSELIVTPAYIIAIAYNSVFVPCYYILSSLYIVAIPVDLIAVTFVYVESS